MNSIQIHTAFATPMQLGESPLWSATEQALYWIDIPDCTIHRLHSGTGTHQSWPVPAQPGSLCLHAGGGLVVALRTGLYHLNTVSGALAMLSPAPYDTTVIRFNDGRCDNQGRFWTGSLYEPKTHAGATLYRYHRGKLHDMGCAVTTSNGVAITPDNTLLYHADTAAHLIRRYQLSHNGDIMQQEVWQTFPSDKTSAAYIGRPDGATIDADGNYWIAMFEGGRILQFSPQGDILADIALPVRCPTMVTFGGDDLRTLFITTARRGRPDDELARYPLSGCVLSLRTSTAGLPEAAYQPAP